MVIVKTVSLLTQQVVFAKIIVQPYVQRFFKYFFGKCVSTNIGL